MKTDLIVAVYRESLNWLRERKFDNEKIYAYNKLPRDDYNFIESLPNVGRESHTFIWHILKNYDKINSDYLMFLQGCPFIHFSGKRDNMSYVIFNHNYNLVHLYYPLGNVVECDAIGQPYSPWDPGVYLIWDKLFGWDLPQSFFAVNGAQQIVHKSLIHNRSKKFWEIALEMHYEYEDAPWAFEILWSYIFDFRYKSMF